MAIIWYKGEPVHTNGEIPVKGCVAPAFNLTSGNLSTVSSDELKGKRIVLNIFPSLDTPVCAQSVRTFNQLAAKISNTIVLAISNDLPFAQSRFCTAEGIDNVEALSAFRSPQFGINYGVLITDSHLKGLLARAVIVIDVNGKVGYSELVAEITHEPNYDKAIAFLSENIWY